MKLKRIAFILFGCPWGTEVRWLTSPEKRYKELKGKGEKT